jgi:hypothetical protein
MTRLYKILKKIKNKYGSRMVLLENEYTVEGISWYKNGLVQTINNHYADPNDTHHPDYL